jgi:hypothetical protein
MVRIITPSSVVNRRTHRFGGKNDKRPSNMVALASLLTSDCSPGSLTPPNISRSWHPRVGKCTQAALGWQICPFQQPTDVGVLECSRRQAHMDASKSMAPCNRTVICCPCCRRRSSRGHSDSSAHLTRSGDAEKVRVVVLFLSKMKTTYLHMHVRSTALRRLCVWSSLRKPPNCSLLYAFPRHRSR